MIDLDRAVAFVRQTGHPLDRLRLRRALGDPVSPAEAEAILAPYQFPDGSWDYDPAEEHAERIGSLGGTIHCLRWLREFGLGNRPQMARTLEFLASIQAADGSFYETEEKLAHSPHGWLQKETLIDRFYFTAAVPMRLFPLDHAAHPVIEPAIAWLTRHWTDWPLVTGTWYNVWALLCIYPEVKTLPAALYRRCHARALGWLPSLASQPLTWLLDALHGASYPADVPLVTEGRARLLALQDEDGIWPDAHDATVETTVTAVRLLSAGLSS
jgi:hypothetical protein